MRSGRENRRDKSQLGYEMLGESVHQGSQCRMDTQQAFVLARCGNVIKPGEELSAVGNQHIFKLQLLVY